jgi:hypothetical protein
MLRTERDNPVGGRIVVRLVWHIISFDTAMLFQQSGQRRFQMLQTHNIARDAFHVEQVSHYYQL